MQLFGLTPERVMQRIQQAGRNYIAPSLAQSLLVGAIGFCVTSLCVFATVAFAERWMYRNLGVAGAYVVWTALFIWLGGRSLSLLVIGPQQQARFYLLFGVAFFLYAAGWVSAYFLLRGASGEWVGSLAGSILLAAVFALGFGALRALPLIAGVLFVANSAGYFLGAAIFAAYRNRVGMILWGLIYGLSLGAGLGAALYFAQAPVRAHLKSARQTETA